MKAFSFPEHFTLVLDLNFKKNLDIKIVLIIHGLH